MSVIRTAICTAILLALSGCSDGTDVPNDGPFKPAPRAAAQQTPAFRNLGKRGDSKL